MKSLLATVVLAPTIVVGAGALGSTAAALSCVGPQVVLSEARVIYAGRIVASSDEEVTLEVDEVWRGTPPAERVTFDVDLPGWWEGSRSDREARLVIAPADGALNPCTVFALSGEMADDVRSFRPASPAGPSAVESSLAGDDPPAQSAVPGWALAAGGAGLLLLAGGLVGGVLRRRR
ncbi:hypothetical protein [Nocardioides sp.]|uniref:hypothetical protein n=1 Tax=Nocardioides sp. TaxID=35761 RepID=UPI002C2CAB28|nr:hypothetical protein [Nocardioides sp.]HSX67432.1 hypothetical protein [Nocardioides sp.]